MKLFRTSSSAIAKCCQLAFNFLPINSQLDNRTAKYLQKFIVSEKNLCHLFSINARRKLDELFARYDNVTTACQLHNVMYDSLNK